MKLMYKGNYEKGRMEMWQNFDETSKNKWYNVIIKGDISITVNQFALGIDMEGKGYFTINTDYMKEYWDVNKKQKMEITDKAQFEKFLIANGFVELKPRNTDQMPSMPTIDDSSLPF